MRIAASGGEHGHSMRAGGGGGDRDAPADRSAPKPDGDSCGHSRDLGPVRPGAAEDPADAAQPSVHGPMND
jgi:hypothetical protein